MAAWGDKSEGTLELLAYLEEHGPCTRNQLCDATGLDYRMVGSRLDVRVANGEIIALGEKRCNGRLYRLASQSERTAKQRKCLRCEKTFPSEGPHNRLCGGCRQFAAEQSPYALPA